MVSEKEAICFLFIPLYAEKLPVTSFLWFAFSGEDAESMATIWPRTWRLRQSLQEHIEVAKKDSVPRRRLNSYKICVFFRKTI